MEIRLPYPPTKKQIKWCYHDYIRYTIKYYADLEVDYFKSGIYRKSDFIRSDSLANYKRFELRDSIQAKEHWKYFQDKREFYNFFRSFLGREYIIVSNDTDYLTFMEFVQKCSGNVFAKLPISCGGKDVFHWKLSSIDEIKAKYDEIIKSGKSYIVEECISQVEDMASFSPLSVNTMRIVTVIDDNGNVRIANALFRIGNGKEVDNFSSGGMAARVDIQTGILMQPAVDGLGKTYLIHPLSHKQIIGFAIPGWSDYINFVKELASKIKDVRYVGWDIIRKSDGTMACIEGNKDAGFDVQESQVNYGYESIYNALLHDEKSFDFSIYGGCI